MTRRPRRNRRSTHTRQSRSWTLTTRKPHRARTNAGRVELSSVPSSVIEAARYIRQASSRVRTNLVGGAVVDLLQGVQPKDWDIEVFGLAWPDLAAIASRLGTASEVGKSFGVLKLVLPDGMDIDLSIPRMDNKVGVKHKDFTVQLYPNMTNKEAARRRDFTINSMAVDLATGKLIDPFHGLEDLQAHILRATDSKLFIEDPLRGLRAMQLLARKSKTVAPSTLALIKSMKAQHNDLPSSSIASGSRTTPS